MLTYHDVTAEPGSAGRAGREHEVEALRAAGLEVLARLQCELPDIAGAAAGYDEPDASWFRENAMRPSTLLSDPERTLLVEVSEWFGGEASLRFRTELDDGSLVETLRKLARGPFEVDPGLPFDMLRSHTPETGRSIEVHALEPAALLAAHRAHVARVAGRARPILHGLESHIPLLERAMQHDIACRRVSGARGMLAIGWLGLSGMLALIVSGLLDVPYRYVAVGEAVLIGTLLFGAMPFVRLVYPWVKRAAPFRGRPPRNAGIAGASLALVAVVALSLLGLGLARGAGWLETGALAAGTLWFVGSVGRAVGEVVSDFEGSTRIDPTLAILGEGAQRMVAEARAGRRDVVVSRLAEVPHERTITLSTLAPCLPDAVVEAWAASDDYDGVIALGYAQLDRAWRARGSGYADTVTEEGAQRFQTHLRRALEVFARAAELRPDAAEPHALACQTLAAVDPEAAERAFRAATERDPTDEMAWISMLSARCAKWFGSDDAMFALARSAPPGLEMLIVRAHLEIWLAGGEHHFDDPAVRRELATAWTAFRDSDNRSLHAWNHFAFALCLAEMELPAREALEHIWARFDEIPWSWYGEPREALAECREWAGLPPAW